jgi:hypothetical protein
MLLLLLGGLSFSIHILLDNSLLKLTSSHHETPLVTLAYDIP